MFCANCGSKIGEGQNFCNACGKTVLSPAAPSARGAVRRVDRHLRVVAVLWLIWSGLRLIPSVALLFFGSFWMTFFPFRKAFFPFRFPVAWLPLAAMVGVILLVYTAAGLIAGWGLLERRSWGRTLALVMSILSLINIPFGTALGIYTLWVLLPPESEADYRHLSGAVSQS